RRGRRLRTGRRVAMVSRRCFKRNRISAARNHRAIHARHIADSANDATESRGTGGMSTLLGRRAVVVGAGLGGLSAAGVLAGYFEQVEIVEGDPLTGSGVSRSGMPQDGHADGLVAGGVQAVRGMIQGLEGVVARARRAR